LGSNLKRHPCEQPVRFWEATDNVRLQAAGSCRPRSSG
jgi:hypothetical protein